METTSQTLVRTESELETKPQTLARTTQRQETASQTLTRTAQRWKTIAHLPPETRTYLMSLTDTELRLQLKLISTRAA